MYCSDWRRGELRRSAFVLLRSLHHAPFVPVLTGIVNTARNSLPSLSVCMGYGCVILKREDE